MDPRCTPKRIRHRERADQGTHILRYTRTPDALSAFPGPKQTEAAAVPADDRLRPDNVKGRAPAAPGTRDPHSQHPVCRYQTKALPAGSIDHRELMSKRQDFEVQRRARKYQMSVGLGRVPPPPSLRPCRAGERIEGCYLSITFRAVS